MGDLLTAVPALRGIREALPDHELVLVTPEWLRPLVELVGCVDTLLPAGELEPVPWTGAPPDVAVDLHGCGPESHRLLTALRPRRLVAYECAEAGVGGPRHDPEEHEVRRWARLVMEGLGVDVDESSLDLARPTAPPFRPGAVVLHLGAASGARRWPPARFAEVARWCAEQDIDVAVTGGADDMATGLAVVRRAGLDDGCSLAGRTRLGELASLVADARLVVSGDTGVAHLATAYRRPSVVLFGPVAPAQWGPPPRPWHHVVGLGAGYGDPHAETLDAALSRIAVDDVLRPMARQLSTFDPASDGWGPGMSRIGSGYQPT